MFKSKTLPNIRVHCQHTLGVSGRICADDDVLVEDTLEVACEPVEDAVLGHIEALHVVPEAQKLFFWKYIYLSIKYKHYISQHFYNRT
jgi:hypothetical protein